MENENRYATNGKGNAALATGIIGTAGVGYALLNGGLGNLFGGNARNGGECMCSENMFVNRYELQLEQKIAEKDAQIALRDSNTYTDQKMIELYKDINARLRTLENTAAGQAVHNQNVSDSFELIKKDIETEAERRCCGDNALANYMNATFYAKQVANVTTNDDTTSQMLYNPLPRCNNCCS